MIKFAILPTSVIRCSRPDVRAYHALKIPLVFGTCNGISIPSTPTEIALFRYIQSAWFAFARDPEQGLVNFGWSLYNPSTASLSQLGNQASKAGVIFTQGNLIDFACAANPAALLSRTSFWRS